MPRILSRSDVQSLLAMDDVIDVVEAGFRECATGTYHIPVRLGLDMPERDAVVLFMPAFLPRSGTLGAKIVSVFPENTARSLPTVMGVYLLYGAESGEFLALMDATYMTGIRTAATSAIATRYLARQDARVLGVFGAGVQARFHVDAMRSVLDIEEIVVYNRTPGHGALFVEEISMRHPVPIRLASTPEICAAAAEVIVTCTRASTPLFDGRAIHPGTHINAVGAFTPDMRELDDETIRRAVIVVDTYAGALAEAGDILIPIRQGWFTAARLHAELGEIITGQKPGRTRPDEITVFKSVGFAMEDAVTAHLVYERAMERNIGAEVAL